MNREKLKVQWKQEEAQAHIHGWDFSHIDGRYEEENDLPWNYELLVRKYLKKEMELLDYDTGGGEFLLSLGHPFAKTSATEGYPPNVKLCKEKLLPLGIRFMPCSDPSQVPFEDAAFDLIINRHGSFDPGFSGKTACSSQSRWERIMKEIWWKWFFRELKSRFRITPLQSREKNSRKQGFRFFRRRKPCVLFCFMISEHLSGSLVLLNGSFQDFVWRNVLTVCAGCRKSLNGTERSRELSTVI